MKNETHENDRDVRARKVNNRIALPAIGSLWRQNATGLYRVIMYANEHTISPEKRPIIIVYQSEASQKIWSMTLVEWRETMRPWTDTMPGADAETIL